GGGMNTAAGDLYKSVKPAYEADKAAKDAAKPGGTPLTQEQKDKQDKADAKAKDAYDNRYKNAAVDMGKYLIQDQAKAKVKELLNPPAAPSGAGAGPTPPAPGAPTPPAPTPPGGPGAPTPPGGPDVPQPSAPAGAGGPVT